MSEEPSFLSHIARLHEVSSFFFFSTGKVLNALKQITFQMGELARTQLDYYYTFYWVGFGALGILFCAISNVNRHTNWFILRSILGIEETKKDPPKPVVLCVNCRNYIPTTGQSNINEQISQHLKNCNDSNRMANSSESGVDHSSEKKQETLNLEKYLFVELEDDENAGTQLKCFVRVFSDFLTSLILTVFVLIIYANLFLSLEFIESGKKCPKYDSDCFIETGPNTNELYHCTEDHFINLTDYKGRLACFAWIYNVVTTEDVLNTLGTCGGLLGLISCIIPLVYYLSHYRRSCYLSCICFIIPAGTMAGFGVLIWRYWERGQSASSAITIILVIVLVITGWVWGFSSSFKRKVCFDYDYYRCPCCGWSCCSSVFEKCNKWTKNGGESMEKKCQKYYCCCRCCHCWHLFCLSCNRILCRIYKCYPWDCLSDIWKNFCCLFFRKNNIETSQCQICLEMGDNSTVKQVMSPVTRHEPNGLKKWDTQHQN